MDAYDTADRLISALGEALNEIGLPPAGRLAGGSTGCAQVCWMDAERCFHSGRHVAAVNRARKGLAYLGLHTAAAS